jgi:hypothetical protein
MFEPLLDWGFLLGLGQLGQPAEQGFAWALIRSAPFKLGPRKTRHGKGMMRAH